MSSFRWTSLKQSFICIHQHAMPYSLGKTCQRIPIMTLSNETRSCTPNCAEWRLPSPFRQTGKPIALNTSIPTFDSVK
ncbi:hypothetical protein BCR44DRAFT_1443657 [Catenaria anguillulae PL171]|uniref:Uncharacterized protein n=1 Tax=Catenaria anguillulae PL171 TaxID=765915 RepID=A0A1Y2H8H6_9FUNG|nr:hypothetical protein BCR44DRAFT_1443657 [Catenaria anguillulae PL171]